MKLLFLTLLAAALSHSPALAAPVADSPATGAKASSVDDVKGYLLETLRKVHAASGEFRKNASRYAELVTAAEGDPIKAAAASGKEVQALVDAMRENYKTMDSFGYEQVEGIVAGVPALADFDVYLDAGVPKAEASGDSPAAPVTLKTSTGRTIDQEGALFTYLVEPMLWGTSAAYTVPVDLDGDGKIAAREALPRSDVLLAAAEDVQKKVGELIAASEAWKPTVEDCFGAMIVVTPTFSDYFEDWKESRYARESSGRFTAVSRVSDMRGIMGSVAVIYRAVAPQLEAKDAALAKSISRGFADIMAFIDRVEAREKKGRITTAQIDELGSQAKAKADKLVPQVEQAAAVLNLRLQGA